jgi:large subunit ribosomal protein L6
MSYLGRKPIKIPTDVKVKKSNNLISIQGPLGILDRFIHESVDLTLSDNEIIVNKPFNKKFKPLWATTRSLIVNMIIGVTQGHSQTLKVVGVGYKAEIFNSKLPKEKNLNLKFDQECQDLKLSLKLGYSHPIYIEIPKTIQQLDLYAKGTVINIQGLDKELISNFAKSIQSFRPPEPYKGKGIFFLGQVIRRKEGKKK